MAKVADFGFATCLQTENDLLSIPKSDPWNAPEYSERLFRPDPAKRMDIYSFGLLCTWLLFEAGSCGGLLLPPDTKAEKGQCITFEPHHSGKNILEAWKRNNSNKLVEWISWLVREDRRWDADMKDNLEKFFWSTLAHEPKSRCIELEHLLGLLVSDR